MFGGIFKNNGSKTDMNANSIKAYEEFTRDMKVGKQQDKIYRFLLGKPAMTSRQIAEELMIDRSSVCGRLNRMKSPEYGLVKVDRNDECPTTKKTVEWYTAVRFDNA